MNQDEYLFLPEAKLVDKLLGVFNIQSQKQLDPNSLISILGLLNLLNIVSITQDNFTQSNQLSNLLTNSNSLDNLIEDNNQAINSQQLQQLIQSLNTSSNSSNNNSNNSSDNLANALSGLLNQQGNQSNSGIENILGMLSGNSNSKLDPTLILKLMNLFNQIKEKNSTNAQDEDQESNQPIKSEPFEEKEEDE